MVRPLSFHCRKMGSIPGQETKVSHSCGNPIKRKEKELFFFFSRKKVGKIFVEIKVVFMKYSYHNFFGGIVSNIK